MYCCHNSVSIIVSSWRVRFKDLCHEALISLMSQKDSLDKHHLTITHFCYCDLHDIKKGVCRVSKLVNNT